MPYKHDIPAVCAHCGGAFLAMSRGRQRPLPRFCSPACALRDRHGTPEQRFWAKVDQTSGCWLWKGSRSDHGYGQLRVDGALVQAHRYSWELHRGPIPEGLEVCHNCPGGDNPLCVNPAHLFLGTHAENMRDALKKGRLPQGEHHRHAKLTPADIPVILARYAAGETQAAIGRDYGVKQVQIGRIIMGTEWRHLLPDGYVYPGNRRLRMTPERVRDIRARRAAGESLAALAKAYETDTKQVWRIATRKVWRHVTP